MVAAAVLGLVAGIGAVWQFRGAPVPAASAIRPNVLLITLDTTRADRLGSYGYAGASTPNLDRLAAAGVRFNRALSSAPLTLPAHASVMTGRHPYTHGVRNNGHFTLAEDVPTLAASFEAAGYETAAFVSSFVLDRQFGLARGFTRYDDALDQAPAGGFTSLELERRGDRTVAAASDWLASRSARAATQPFFLWVHLYDAHHPYVPPSPFREQFAGRPYDGEIAFDDALVGALLQRAGFGSAATMVVVAGDHGESLGDHGESTHGLFVYDAALRVPLLMAGPALAPSVVNEPVRLIDVAPTILDLAGVAALPSADGRSLRAVMAAGGSGEEAPPIYAETYFPQFFMGWSPLRTIQTGRWKFIEAPEPELYDLSADPTEQTNLIEREPATAGALRRVLESSSRAGTRMTPTPLSAQARERLASLGYVSTVTPPTSGTAGPAGPDPKRMVALFERLLEGNHALASGRLDDAARISAEVLRQDEGNGFAHQLQGRAALAQGRNREAMSAFAAYLKLVPGSADAHHWTALAALRLGDRQRALAEEEATLAIDPRHTAAISLRAGLLFSSGRKDEGIASLREAMIADPSNQALVLELADLLADAKRFDEAEPLYRRSLAARPRDGRALTGLGLLLSATNRLDLAVEQLTRALEVEERDDEARLARAEVYEKLGRAQEARLDYEALASSAARPDLRQLASGRLAALK